MRKFLLTILIISCLCMALSVFAQIELEQTYPEIKDQDTGQTVQRTLTGKSTLPSLIQYLTNWALILAALAVVISLIIGGIQYLTSSGMPEKMTDARKKISNSFLGLAILAGSYLILVTINPQLTVMSLVVAPVDSGVVLFTEEGYNSLGDPEKNLSDIIFDGYAKIFTTGSVDLTQEKDFGPLVQTGTIDGLPAGTLKVNFAHFPIYAIGFWGREGSFSDNIKVVAYDAKHFTQSIANDELNPREYTRKGKLDKDGGEDITKDFRPASDPPMKAAELEIDVIWIEKEPSVPPAADKSDFFSSKVEYINLTKSLYDEKIVAGEKEDTFPTATTNVYHPPLSIDIRGTGPGVYLYSEEGGQRYISYSHPDLGLSDMKFDNMAGQIEINNYEKKDDGSDVLSHDYLAVLHDYYHFAGNLRFFFAKRDIYLPNIYLHGSFQTGGTDRDVDLCHKDNNEDGECDDGPGLFEGLMGKDDFYNSTDNYFYGVLLQQANAYNSPWEPPCWPSGPSAGNIPDSPDSIKVAINDQIDPYGYIKSKNKASSLQIFELSPHPEVKKTCKYDWSDFVSQGSQTKECEEVRLCTGKGATGHCISYTPGGKVFEDAYNSITLPMPYYIPVNIPKHLKGIVKNDQDKYEIQDNDFADKIKSIYIRGNCLVALFENPVIDTRLCLENCEPNGVCEKCWDGTPGSHSETFLKSDGNLTDNEIAQCGSARGIFFREPNGCASSIVVFPIRVTE